MIEVENLSKRFGKTQAVAGLSFRVEPRSLANYAYRLTRLGAPG